MWRLRRPGPFRPGIGWGYLWVQYAGWWLLATVLAVLLVRVDSPRPVEVAAAAAYVAIAVVVGVLLKREWDTRER